MSKVHLAIFEGSEYKGVACGHVGLKVKRPSKFVRSTSAFDNLARNSQSVCSHCKKSRSFQKKEVK